MLTVLRLQLPQEGCGGLAQSPGFLRDGRPGVASLCLLRYCFLIVPAHTHFKKADAMQFEQKRFCYFIENYMFLLNDELSHIAKSARPLPVWLPWLSLGQEEARHWGLHPCLPPWSGGPGLQACHFLLYQAHKQWAGSEVEQRKLELLIHYGMLELHCTPVPTPTPQFSKLVLLFCILVL